MSDALLLLLLGFVIYLERRLSRLELTVREAYAAPHESPVWDYREQPGAAAATWPAAEWQSGGAPEPDLTPELRTVVEPESTPALVEADEQPEIGNEPASEDNGPSFSFEEWFGRRLPIWAGGITLAVAGVLIVKLSIEAGLVSPTVRVISGLLFGLGLIGGAETARRFEDRVRDVRIRQALSGAGLASLYASILIAANLYGLISSPVAMLGIALVTALAMGLALRFGAPSALLGLAGGLAAPALIGSNEPNVPLLSLYLALTVGGLAALSRSQRWAWLGISTLVGGFGWGLLLLVGGALDAPSAISLGLFILLLGIGLPALGLAGNRSQQLQLIAGIIGSAQMAALIATGDFAMLNWGLFAALAIASVWLANREPKLTLLPPVGLAIALLLLGAWPHPTIRDLAIVIPGTALIYAPLPIRRLWTERGALLDAGQIALIGFASWLVAALQLHELEAVSDTHLGLLALAMAVMLAIVVSLGWRTAGREDDSRFAILSVPAAFLLAASASLLVPEDWAGSAIMIVGLGLLHLGQIAKDRRLEPFAWIFAGAGLLSVIVPSFGNLGASLEAARYGLTALLAAIFAWRGGYRWARATAQALAPALLYVAVAPILANRFDPLIAPLLLLGLAIAWRREKRLQLAPAMATSGLILLAWALEPMGNWTAAGIAALFGEPFLVARTSELPDVCRQLLIPGALGTAAVLVASHLPARIRTAGLAGCGVMVGIALHIFYKQIFAIGTDELFVARGLAERALWEAILAGAAAAALHFGWRRWALGLAAAGAAHLIVFTLILHNPLWAAQQVGTWPLLNLLLPVYALAFGLTLKARKIDLLDDLGPIVSGVQMLLIALFAFSTLRQLFHGTLLVQGGLTQAEDIGRSVTAIALGVGFLLWGITKQERPWRLASLGLMLAAVGKVFLLDASGLEGVTRIASFVALGFSLIGIGWLYARYLPSTVANKR